MELPLPLPSDPTKETVSPARAAYDALSDAQKKILRSYAHALMRGRGRKIQHSDGEDLYNEAIMRALDDPEWDSADPMKMFYRLLGHIYNITRSWALKRRIYSDSEMPEVAVPPHDIHDEDDEARAIHALKRRLRTQVVASTVLDTILNGEKPAEAVETLGISMRCYTTNRRRVFREAKKLYPSIERPKS